MDAMSAVLDRPLFDAPRDRARRDLAVVAALALLMFWLAATLELSEALLHATRPYEGYQLDELPLVVLTLAAGLAWFSWRRRREYVLELRLRRAAQAELVKALEENRSLSQRYLLAQEEERRHLAHELHDELGQCLNAIKLDAVAIRDAARDGPPAVQEGARAIIGVADHVYELVRNLSRQLRPLALDELGLRDALEHCVREWQRRNPQVECDFRCDSELAGLGELANITLYRMVQECLTNVARHAGARRVCVSVERAAAGVLRLAVNDDGCGLDPQAQRRGLGLVGLRERVEALGGRLFLDSAPGRGLRVEAALPVARLVRP